MGASRLLLRSAAARLTSAFTSSSAAALGSAGGATAASGLAVALHPAWRQATGDLPIAASAARHYWAAATASAAQAHAGGLPGLPTRSQAARQPHSVAPTGLQQRSQTTTDGGASLPPAHQLLLDRNLLLDTLDTVGAGRLQAVCVWQDVCTSSAAGSRPLGAARRAVAPAREGRQALRWWA